MTRPRGRPGVRVGTSDVEESTRELAGIAQQGFAVESGVNMEGQPYARIYFGDERQVMRIEDGWTIVRLLAEALAAAEADALVWNWANRTLGGPDKAGYLIAQMREERGRADVSAERRHFYERIIDKG